MGSKGFLEKVVDVVAGVAPTVANLVMPGSGPLVHGLIRTVAGDDESVPIEESAAKVFQDPAKLVELKRIAADREVRLAEIAAGKEVDLEKIDADKIESVNATMRTEAATGHPWAGAWRPFWGFCSAVAFVLSVLGIIGLGVYAVYKAKVDLLKVIPDLVMALAFLFGVPGAILGVASWHRGVKQRVEAGDAMPGIVGQIAGLVSARKGS